MEKILIVDDSADIRELVKVTLGDDQYQVFEAESGTAAIEMARLRKPDVIIMDIIMPGSCDGIAAAKAIKKEPALKTCHIIFLSGSRIDPNRLKSIKQTSYEYIIKPFSPLHLLERIEQCLARKTFA